MEISDYLSKTIFLNENNPLQRLIIYYLAAKSYKIAQKGGNDYTHNAYFTNDNYSCNIYWSKSRLNIFEYGIELDDKSPILGYTIRKFSEIDRNTYFTEFLAKTNEVEFRGRLSVTPSKTNSLFYYGNRYETINFEGIEASRTDEDYIAILNDHLEKRTIELIAKQSGQEKIVKQP